MEKRTVKILSWFEVEDRYSGEVVVVENDSVYGTDEYREFLKDELSFLVDIKNEDDEDIINEFTNAIENLTNGKDASYLDYEFSYTNKIMVC